MHPNEYYLDSFPLCHNGDSVFLSFFLMLWLLPRYMEVSVPGNESEPQLQVMSQLQQCQTLKPTAPGQGLNPCLYRNPSCYSCILNPLHHSGNSYWLQFLNSNIQYSLLTPDNAKVITKICMQNVFFIEWDVPPQKKTKKLFCLLLKHHHFHKDKNIFYLLKNGS